MSDRPAPPGVGRGLSAAHSQSHDVETSMGSETLLTGGSDLSVQQVEMPGLTILCHPDATRIGERVTLPLWDRRAALARGEPKFVAADGRQRGLDVAHVSRRPLLLVPGAAARSVCLDRRSTRMPIEVDGHPLESTLEVTHDDLRRGAVLLIAHRVVVLLHVLDPMLPTAADHGLVGESASMVQVGREISQVADLDVPVLIRGESGTGKELVAAAIHRASRRRNGPWVALNMGAIPPSLAAAELFGADKGAFTGAGQRRQGSFAEADGGTLFLDELGETPDAVQPLLLRTLETGELQTLGSARRRKVDVRILAATDADLETAIAAQRFRAPLLHRLSGFEIVLPPLRRRREDIGRLLLAFLRQELDAVGEAWRLQPREGAKPWLNAAVVARLARAQWPGNVRQLRNIARQLMIHNRGGERLLMPPKLLQRLGESPAVLETSVSPESQVASPPADDLQGVGSRDGELSRGNPSSGVRGPDAPAPSSPEGYRAPSEVDEDELVAVLEEHQYRLQPAAKALRISRTSLYALIEQSPRVRKAKDLTMAQITACRDRHGGDLSAMAAELKVSRKGLSRRMTLLGMEP